MNDGQLIEGFRLSPQQRRVWLLQGDSQAYRAQCAIAIEGELDKEVLKTALRTVIVRHEILRTTFYLSPQLRVRQEQNGVPKFPSQRITERDELSGAGVWKEVELLEDESSLEGILQQARQAPFKLDEGPLLRTRLFAVSQSTHLLLLDLHALCADQATLRNLFAEIVYSYTACLNGEQIQEQPLQYADISEWQNELLEAKDTEPGRAYWQKQDFNSLTATRLPCEKSSSVSGEFSAKEFSAAFDSHELERLKALAAQYDVPLAVVLLAGWSVLLWRLTRGDSAVLVGTAYDGRKYEQVKSTLGLLNRFLPVQQSLTGTLPFSRVMRQLHDRLNELEKWQEYFSWEGRAEPNLNGNSIPFIPFLFNFEQYPTTVKTDGVSFKFYKTYACVERFKIQLTCAQTEHSLNAEFHYDPRNFDAESTCRLASQFKQLLRSAIEKPETLIDELEILSKIERDQLIKDFNRTESSYPPDEAIHQLIEQQVARTPERVAVICRGYQLTYADLNARANQLAQVLRRKGVGPETPVGLLVERSVEMIAGLLGILKAGGAYVPLNPEHPPARLLAQLAELNAPVVLTQRELSDHLPNFAGELISLEQGLALLRDEDETDQDWIGTPQQLAYVIYTSGSTGTSKGVSITHRNLVNYTNYICEKLRLYEGNANEPLNFATVSTLSADLGNTCVFPSLVSGGCLHIITYDVATDAELFSDYASAHRFDVLKIVPSHLQQLLSTSEGSRILPRRFLITGGEALSQELARSITSLGQGCQLLNHYGPTETTIGSVVNSKVTATLDASADSDPTATVPIGGPIANTRLYILDKRQRILAPGMVGELYIGGAGVGRGYYGRPELTAEKFLPDEFSQEAGARLYRTGDLGRYLADGNVEFMGRVDDQVKIRGYRVEPGEIAAALRQHPAVGQAVVVARRDNAGQPARLLAYFVARADEAAGGLSVGELRGHLKGLLPGYMIPHAIMQLQRLPLTANGKLDQRALPEPEVVQTDEETAQQRPRTAAEETLVRIWSEVLGIAPPGRHDNFFELGGDSIISIQIVSQAKKAGLQLTPRQLFEQPTIAKLALVAGQVSGPPSGEQGVVSGRVPLTPIQQWFFEQELQERHHFNQTVLLQVRQWLKREVLEAAVRGLVAQHDALRLRYVRGESGWEQFNAAEETQEIFTYRDLSELAPAEQSATVEREAAQWQGSLDLEQGPLLRVVYFDLGTERAGRLLLVIHHLAVDGVSWRILLADLQRACEQLERGEAVSLGEKSSSFKQWAERLEEYAESEAVKAEIEYWMADRRHGVKGLPVDHEEGANSFASSVSVSVELSAEETQWLLQEVGEAYGTQIQEVLLTALAEGIRRWSGERRVLVDLEGHGREEVGGGVDVSRTVGWFTTIYPVLLELAEESDPGSALKRVKEQMRGVPERGIGYGLLRYMSRDEQLRERLREMPSAEIRFNYLGQFDQSIGEESMYSLAPESAGPNRSPRDKRITKLVINGNVIGGRLHVTWTFSENTYNRSTIEKLAQDYIEALRELIEHCRLPEAGGYTPSDFPEAALSQEELDDLLAEFSRSEVQS